MKYNFYSTFKRHVGDPLESDELMKEYIEWLKFVKNILNISTFTYLSIRPLAWTTTYGSGWILIKEDMQEGLKTFNELIYEEVDLEPFLFEFLTGNFIGCV